MKNRNDPDPEKKKINNSDEQEIAVNYSTQENGFDEPDSSSDKEPEPSSEKNEKDDKEIQNQSETPSETFKE